MNTIKLLTAALVLVVGYSIAATVKNVQYQAMLDYRDSVGIIVTPGFIYQAEKKDDGSFETISYPMRKWKIECKQHNDYQLDVHETGVDVWEENRFVGCIKYSNKDSLWRLIDEDNL